MRLSMPPFFPPYAVLFLVVAYAAASLWFGLARLDDIARQTEATTRNAATIDDLRALLNAVSDIEAAGPLAATASADSAAATFERGRRRVPMLLSALRDKVRDDASELALVEELVPLIGERTTAAASGIERRRTAPEGPVETAAAQRGTASSDQIRALITSLELHEQADLEQSRQARVRTIGEARRDLYITAGVTLLLVTSLFLAVRRLRSFLRVIPAVSVGSPVIMAAESAPAAKDFAVGTLLRDALLRARLAEAEAAPTDSGRRERLGSLVAAMEQALSAHAGAYAGDRAQPEAQGVARAMALLAQAYTRPEGLTVKATIDRSVTITDARKAFLVYRSAQWALEAITLRKRTGDVTLEFVADGDRVYLRIHALTDNPELPVTLTPMESEEATALREGITALAGTYIAGEGPAGFSLTLTVPTGN